MQKHRIFIAINLPEEIKDELVKYQDKYFDLPAKWTKKENLHITLEFIGNALDKDLEAIFKKTEDFALKTKPFKIKLDKISYFPDNNLPKYVFANSENSSRNLHVTLARISQWQWRQIGPEDRPNVEENIDLSFEAKSIEVMESFLKRGGPEYKVLKSFKL
jgi:RNA 2',3'-cyclic 3'-phosphodiesterase